MFQKTTIYLLKTEKILYLLEKNILVIGLIIMIFAGTMQVILRNLFNTGVEWADMFVRTLVLWLGFLGASLATRREKHINIDIVSKLIKNPKAEKLRVRIVNIIAFLLIITLLKASISYTLLEAQNNMYAFLKVPTWVVFIIVPISLTLIALRLLLQFMLGETLEKEDLPQNKEVNL